MILYSPKGEPVKVDSDQVNALIKDGFAKEKPIKAPSPKVTAQPKKTAS